MQERGKLEKIKRRVTNFTWVCVNHANEKTTRYLRRTFKFHHLDLEDCLSPIQRPKIDDYEDYLFLILHFPVTIID